jgi:hypothetical protein
MLALVQTAWAQTKFTERLDSIVTDESRTTYKKVRKFEFGYNAKGQVAQVLYYRWDEGGWSLTNKREYLYDEQGRDTLRVVFLRENGQWELLQQRYSTYGRHGEKLQERTVQYAKGEMQTESRWDCVYNEEGKQVSASRYWRRIRTTPEEWKKEWTLQDEYDAKGNLVKEVYEYLNMLSTEKGTTVMCYDEEGILTAKIDSSYNVLLGGREWRRKDFSYSGQKLSVMKDLITTIDHDMVHQLMDESLFDPQGNLLQRRFYRQIDEELKHASSESYFYDLNQEGSSIMGYDFVPEILEFTDRHGSLKFEGKDIFHHKLMMMSEFWHQEGEDDEEDDDRVETRFYYTIF